MDKRVDTRIGKDSAGRYVSLDVAPPTAVKYYNMFMGGFDKSDQLIRITCQEILETIFLHPLNTAATKAFILYKLLQIGCQRLPTKRHLYDQPVIQIIKKYSLSLPTAVLIVASIYNIL